MGLVSERRKKVTPSLDDIKTGRIYIGREALQIGLIDAIGDEETAIKWFTDVRQVKAGLKVRDRKPESSSELDLFNSSAAAVASKLGLGALFDAGMLEALQALKERPLDGLFSIWHP